MGIALRPAAVSAGVAFALLAAAAAGPAYRRPAQADAGEIRLHLLGKDIGSERYRIDSRAAGVLLTDTFEYVDRGGRLALVASLETGEDLAPRRFLARGRSYRFLAIDAEVQVRAGTAWIRSLGDTSRVPITAPYFTVQGYAPLASRALMVQYWERHGRPRSLAVVPGAPDSEVVIEAHGEESFAPGGSAVRLRRYSIDGVAWGREILWLDGEGRFAALFTRANILPFAGVRTDLEALFPELQARAVRHFMDHFAELSAQLAPVAERSFALTGARLVDGTGGTPVVNATVVVHDGRIAAAGPAGDVPVPAGIRSIDVTGLTIVPGLWDMHAHAAQVEWGPAYLAAGVTTIRDMGGEAGFATAFRDAIDAGRGLGPRLLLTGLVDGPGPAAFGTVTAATPREGIAVVDAYRSMGYQQIKLYTQLAPAVAGAIIARAHEQGMKVTGHVPRSMTLDEAIVAGFDHIAHLPQLGDPGSETWQRRLHLMREHGTVADPTLSWNELLGRPGATPIRTFQPGIDEAPWPIAYAYGSVRNETTPAAADSARRRGLGAVKALFDAGIDVVAGTDYGVPGHSLHRELELYVEAGLTPMAALRSATAVPARVMGLAAETGTIEPGKRADLLILDGDPLADIANIRRGRWVVVGGRMFETTALWRAAGFAAPR